ncbi:hypothetical protein BGM19_12590 [Streptomyces agglomeratus]|uniref:DUF6578 domain-containing protein n=1 Tax=Streptomyces agglomeratus TaxID=285458 RepID=UPI00086D5A61|nr:DUF6578 domain-containing protein [Streptomyces agglomeratus]OEJ58708.1 hypothetical protein BGM19_12590 [Streptomyces agglomeratus]
MALWRILYDDWQMECCGEPFSVGDEVRWRLSLRTPEDPTFPDGWEESYSELEPVAGNARLVGGPGVIALRAGPDQGKWPARPGPVVGLLAVETHGPGPRDVPETTGTVRSIRIVTEGYTETHAGSRSYEPVAGERWLRPVGTCPDWFGNETRPDRDGRGYRHDETGVLVELETPGDGHGGPASALPGQ